MGYGGGGSASSPLANCCCGVGGGRRCPQEQRRIHWCAANFQASTSKSQFQRRGGISWPGLAFPLSVSYLACLFVCVVLSLGCRLVLLLRQFFPPSSTVVERFFFLCHQRYCRFTLSLALFSRAKAFRYVLFTAYYKRCRPSLLFIQGGAE